MQTLRVPSRVTASFLGLALFVASATASAGIHTWDVREVFSNADGSIQFVELIDNGTGGGEVNVGNGSISTNLQGTISWSNGAVAPPTNGRSYLIATPAFAALPGAPTPDVIVDPSDVPIFDNTGDTVSFGPYDSLTFGATPTDGTSSIDDVSGVGPNSPTNYAGISGSVDASGPPSVPVSTPMVLAVLATTLVGLSVASLGRATHRRRAS